MTITNQDAKAVAYAESAVEAVEGNFFTADYSKTNAGDAAKAEAEALLAGTGVSVTAGTSGNPSDGVHTVELTLSKGSFSAKVTVTGTCENHTGGSCI